MEVKACPTHVIQPGEKMSAILDRYFPTLEEKTVIAITSKIISVCEKRFVSKEDVEKVELIRREADAVLDGDHPLMLTIKNGLLIPASGIDESNSEWGYILYPADISAAAIEIWNYLCASRRVKELGIIITDSRTTPMRRGVTGVALGWCGFAPLYNYIGKPDLFGRALKVTLCNVVDALATAAVLAMGEGDEQTPFALITHPPKTTFLDRPPSKEEIDLLAVSLEEDLYAPLLKAAPWRTYHAP